MRPTATIREARPSGVPRILELVHALAAYEREPEAVQATAMDFHHVLFPDLGTPTTHCEVAVVDGEVIGIAVWYVTFSTWTGRNGLWLEDLFVLPEHRGTGLGRALLARLAQIAVERGYRRVEWWVLDWNAPSIAFYKSLGAVPQEGWTTFRLDGSALVALVDGENETV